ncbi:MAG: NAD(P)-dependent oxidoreductase [Sulfurimonas sp.]|nr:NAD(P)-dependent oxidoreductase [Sulfurimonas sp.]
MNILVTGSKGFLGTYFKNNFLNNKDKIIYGTTSEVEDSAYMVFDDLYQNIEKVLKNQKIDVIIHFASIIPKTFEETNYTLFENNNKMMNNLYEYSVKNHLNKFIYLSSFGSMNDPKLLDIKDFYTMSKITGEHFCSMMEAKGTDTVSFRISAPYGEYSKVKNVINIFIDKALKNEDITLFGTGSREQNFTYAGDIINAVGLVLEKRVNGIFEIVSNNNISMLSLARLIKTLIQSESKIIFNNKIDPQEDYRPSYCSKKAFISFGYKSKYSLEDGLKKHINWYINR